MDSNVVYSHNVPYRRQAVAKDFIPSAWNSPRLRQKMVDHVRDTPRLAKRDLDKMSTEHLNDDQEEKGRSNTSCYYANGALYWEEGDWFGTV